MLEVSKRICAIAAIAAMLPLAGYAGESHHRGKPSHKDLLIERELPVTQYVDPTLPSHTIFRPTNLKRLKVDVPIVLWENGGCSWNMSPYIPFLTRVAASGFVVLAKGNVEGTGGPPPRPPGDPLTIKEGIANMEQALNWIVAENRRPRSVFHREVDVSRIAAMGYSCGGFISMETAAIDHRLDTLLIFNSSNLPTYTTDQVSAVLQGIRAGVPLGIINGGPTDIAYPNAVRDWALIPDWMPAVFGNFEGAGHGGFWVGPNSLYYQDRLSEYAIHWLDYTLVSGNRISKKFVLSDDCGMCDDPTFSFLRQNWREFRAPKGPPRRPHH